MPRFTLSTDLPTGVESVWNLLGGFTALPYWHPGIERSSLAGGGSMRTLHMLGGALIIERSEATEEGYEYSCSVSEAPLPIKSYTATIAVKPRTDGSGCVIEWSGDYQPTQVPENDATRIMQGIYQVGFDNMKRLFGV